jgi:hypothetical protein
VLNVRRSPLLLIAIIFASLDSRASTEVLHVLAGYPDYALFIGHMRTGITYEDTGDEAEIRYSQLGLSFAEGLTDWLKIRLSGGNVGFTLKDSINGDNFEPTGFFWTLSFESYLPVSDNFALSIDTGYQYMKTEKTQNDEALDYRVNMLELELSGIYRLTPSVSVGAGAINQWIDGRERFTSGGTTSSFDFQSSESLSGVVHTIFHVNTNQQVGITATGGARDSLLIYFKYIDID